MGSKLEDEFLLNSSNNLWEISFRKLQNETYPVESSGSFNVSRNPRYIQLNRYRNVLPYDDNLIELSDFSPSYINASLIKSDELPNQSYIFTQGPLDSTISHFWLMVWQNKCPGIIMLNRIYENGALKCSLYFPEKVGVRKKLANVNLLVECTQIHKFANYNHRILKIIHLLTNEEIVVNHFNFTEWPDFGAPKSPEEYLEFLNAVRSTGVLDVNDRPSVVHCSAGIGRSGTFALIDIALKIIEKDKSLDNINVHKIVKDLRQCRAGVIQSPDQLKFCYLAIISGGKMILESNFSHHEETKPRTNMSGLDTKEISNGQKEPNETIHDENTNHSNTNSAPEENFLKRSSTESTTRVSERNEPIKTVLPNNSESRVENESKLKDENNSLNNNNNIQIIANENKTTTITNNHSEVESNSVIKSKSDANYDTKDVSKPNVKHIDENKEDSLKSSDEFVIVSPEKTNDNNNTNNTSTGDIRNVEILLPNQDHKFLEKVERKTVKKSQNTVDTIEQFISREDFSTETDYHLAKIQLGMATHNMKPSKRILPQCVRSQLRKFFIDSRYIRSTKQAIQFCSIVGVLLFSIFAYYLNQYISRKNYADED